MTRTGAQSLGIVFVEVLDSRGTILQMTNLPPRLLTRKQAATMVQRLEWALVMLAYLIEIDGDKHLPMYEQYEAKLAELRATDDAKARARQRLNAFVAQGSSLAALIAPTISEA